MRMSAAGRTPEIHAPEMPLAGRLSPALDTVREYAGTMRKPKKVSRTRRSPRSTARRRCSESSRTSAVTRGCWP
jgi:hypothetical protein